MKKLFFILGIMFSTAVLFQSCVKDADLRVPSAPLYEAPMVLVDFDASPLFNVANLAGSKISGSLYAPSNNVASYKLKVRKVSGGAVTAYADLFTTTTLPYNFSITPGTVASALGIQLNEIYAGDLIQFRGESVGTDGRVITINSLDADYQSEPAQKQSYSFQAWVSCPFSASQSAGLYTVEVDGWWEEPGRTIEVVAGTGDQIIVKDFYGQEAADGQPAGFYDVAIDVDPNSGIATIVEDPKQYVWNHPTYGLVWLDAVSSNGFVFSCSGTISMSLRHRVAAGYFSNTSFIAVKQ